MSLKFEIEGDPPRAEDLSAERERILSELASLRKREFRFLIVAVISVVSLLGFAAWAVLPTLKDPGVEPNLVAIIGYFIPYFVFFMFFVGISLHRRRIERPRERLVELRDSLEAADAGVLAEVGTVGDLDPVIAAYRARVAAQGRALTVAEARAIGERARALARDAGDAPASRAAASGRP